MIRSKYFTQWELTYSYTAKRLGIDNTPPEELLPSMYELMDLLDKIREKWGRPIIVTSGYRCPELNSAVGGSKTSQHKKFEAADIKPASNQVKKLFDMIVGMIDNKEIEVGQLIDEKGYSWVHVSLPKLKKNNQIKHM